MTERTGLFETSLGTVAYAAVGRGPVVVLLHGNPGDARDWDAVVDTLAQRHTVIRVDWPGYGRSPHPPGAGLGAPDLARVLDEILDQIADTTGHGVRKVTLVGHSVGGYAALCQALTKPHRVAAVVLVAPGGFTRFTTLTRRFVQVMGSAPAARWLAGPLAAAYTVRRTQASRDALRRARLLRSHPRRSAMHSAVWRSFLDPAHDLRGLAPAIAVPVLLTWGRLDPVVPWCSDGRRAARHLPHATVARFWSGHLPHAEVPHQWLAAVVPFLNRVTQPCGEAPAKPSNGACTNG